MSSEKRLILFVLLSLVLMLGMQTFLETVGLVPKRKPRPPQQAAQKNNEPNPIAPVAQPDDVAGQAGDSQNAPPDRTADKPRLVAGDAAPDDAPPVPAEQLILGDVDPKAAAQEGFRMRVELSQKGASLAKVQLASHEAERTDRRRPREPLTLVDANPERFPDATLPPLGIELIPFQDGKPQDPISLGGRRWEVLPDADGRYLQTVEPDPSRGLAAGQRVVFRTRVPALELTVEKSVTLRRAADALRVDLRFDSPHSQSIALRLQGPYGIPIEGEWYTGTFREVFFGKLVNGATEVETRTASEVLDKEKQGDPIRATSNPLRFAGIENQYFAVFIQPDPLPEGPDRRIDEKTVATVITPAKETQKSEISLVVQTRPFDVGPGAESALAFVVFAGPKTAAALQSFGADDLATYRKGQFPVLGPLGTILARTVITPLLDQIYGLTAAVGRVFGSERGNYGVAIILLTFVVRLAMFPLSRKQAMSAKKMQDLQPQLLELREKYKDDKEKIGKETFALYQRHGVNPFGGCLLVLIQMPIFLGLWQALNSSVSLRNAGFLWISNLAAPDQLFKFPTDIPLLGPYFNLLPLAVAGLMLVHTKLFSPPAATPEQEQSQKVMKWMMVVMAVMFYRVPAGLCVYFITSSLWSIGERMLLPNLQSKPAADKPEAAEKAAAPATSGKGQPNGQSPSLRDRLKQRLDDVMEKAAHDKTVRNVPADRPADRKRRPRRPRG